MRTPFECYKDMMTLWAAGDGRFAAVAREMLRCLVDRNEDTDDPNWYVSALSMLHLAGGCDRDALLDAIDGELSDDWAGQARDAVLLGRPYDPLCWLSDLVT